ncbi:PIN domain nuclease of toxin-antitoxin system [Pararhizobium capsulatum DSM 1112]|uniref:PIN domain nuclease of toxin-antitoxin system n=1 Tax=Pararhizobium capsulatum DSM 1112 TaxID=1121113 RepID=A0ABU0BSM3_9HYPH|nr:PIN domain nuclease of toxin-antitoxin system [Pararhizobium capsulatum DSM 1112]
MRLLLDTHIFIALVEERMRHLPAWIGLEIESSQNDLYLSVARLWEMATNGVSESFLYPPRLSYCPI